jgi:hypothetical protein
MWRIFLDASRSSWSSADEEAVVHEVVAFDPRERRGEIGVLELLHVRRVQVQVARRAFPHGPRARGGRALVGVAAGQAPVVRAHQVVAFLLRDRLDVLLPQVRVDRAGALRVLVEPVELRLAQQEDPAQHQLGHARREHLRVRERERGAPAAAEHLPFLDAEVLAQLLKVVDEVPRRVVDEARMRRALAAAALVEQHDAVRGGVEEAPHPRIRAATGPAVQEHDRLAARVAALFVVQLVHFRDAEPAGVVRADRWIQAVVRQRPAALRGGRARGHQRAPSWRRAVRRR